MEFTQDDQASQLYYCKDPAPGELGSDAREFLKRLPGPTHIHVSGNTSSRSRVLVTLLHGNEPSGLFAIFELLRMGIKPVMDIHCFIASVDAAKQEPGFVYRMLPHHRDLNRCFRPPFGESEEELLAKAILDTINQIKPECVIDIHNTSGSSPGFGVTTFIDDRHDALVSLFTSRMIITDLKLGALMEISETHFPTVTIECGGVSDPESNRVATEGLIKYFSYENVLAAPHGEIELDIFHHPMRMELKDDCEIAFGDHSLVPDGVTLLSDIEHYNFDKVHAGTILGFVPLGLEKCLSLKDANGKDRIGEYFQVEAVSLQASRDLKLFMVTTNPEIARKDCLFYLVEADKALQISRQG